MILTDAGPLIALFSSGDQAHKRCVKILEGIEAPLATTVPVLTEAFHLLNAAGAASLMDFIKGGGLQILFPDDESLGRAFELMGQYADAGMDFADASLVAAAENLSLRKIFTIDQKDFGTYRIRRGHRHISFEILS